MAFYLSEHLRASVICSSTGSQFRKPEIIIAEISSTVTSKLLLAVVYRPPNTGYLNEFFRKYSELQVEYRHVLFLILGDFNADMSLF